MVCFLFSGTVKELAAMAFTAYITKAAIIPTELDRMLEKKREYAEKLHICSHGKDTIIPDPLKLDDMEGEKDSMDKWPKIGYGDILLYLKEKKGIGAQDVLNKYKEVKAFSFYSSGFVKEVFYKDVEDVKLLRTTVSRSTRLNEPPHQVWACVADSVKVLRAYCTCTAG